METDTDHPIKKVWITRPRDGGEKLKAELDARSVGCAFEPLLEIEEIAFSLPDVARYDALVFTSGEAVRIYAKHARIFSKKAFAVGDATADALKSAGFKDVISAGGDVRDLIRIISAFPALKSLLQLAGEDRARDLKAALQHKGINVDVVTLYRARAVEKLSDEILSDIKNGEISHILLFSPRTAETLAALLAQQNLSGVSAVCISDAAAARLASITLLEIRVALKPSRQGVIDALLKDDAYTVFDKDDIVEEGGQALLADPVIAIFGGIRPLATRLGITASTVQGWKKRGLIPHARVAGISKAAAEDGFSLEGLMAETLQPEQELSAAERRRTERRMNEEAAAQWARHNRRTGFDRRSQRELYHEALIKKEKIAFLQRAVITLGCMITAVLLIGGILLAPEYKQLSQKAKKAEELEAQLAQVQSQLKETAHSAINTVSPYLEQRLNVVEGSISGMKETLSNITAMLSKVEQLKQSPEGQDAYAASMQELQSAILGIKGDVGNLGAAVETARKDNATLASILKDVKASDAGAAALLLALNQFRETLGRNNEPFENDLQVMKTLVGAKPELAKALDDLAPYAASGVLSPETLGTEFQGLAGEIVMAKFRGEDASVKGRVMNRLGKLVTVRKKGMDGTDPDAIVARAQALLAQGNVPGALAELNGLSGAPAETAAGWIKKAQGRVTADSAIDRITQALSAEISADSTHSLDSLQNLIKDSVPAMPSSAPVYPAAP